MAYFLRALVITSSHAAQQPGVSGPDINIQPALPPLYPPELPLSVGVS